MFAFPFAPRTWAACDGQQMAVLQNTALFSLIGTVYGGDGKTNFNLPDLRGRVPVHRDPTQSLPVGSKVGTETVTLTTANMPVHTHSVYAKTVNGDRPNARGNYFAQPVPSTTTFTTPVNTYGSTTSSANLATMAPDTFDNQGGSAPHDNTQPSLPINFCIALTGNFPPRY